MAKPWLWVLTVLLLYGAPICAQQEEVVEVKISQLENVILRAKDMAKNLQGGAVQGGVVQDVAGRRSSLLLALRSAQEMAEAAGAAFETQKHFVASKPSAVQEATNTVNRNRQRRIVLMEKLAENLQDNYKVLAKLKVQKLDQHAVLEQNAEKVLHAQTLGTNTAVADAEEAVKEAQVAYKKSHEELSRQVESQSQQRARTNALGEDGKDGSQGFFMFLGEEQQARLNANMRNKTATKLKELVTSFKTGDNDLKAKIAQVREAVHGVSQNKVKEEALKLSLSLLNKKWSVQQQQKTMEAMLPNDA